MTSSAVPSERTRSRNRLTAKIWVCFSGESQYGSTPNNFRSCGELRRADGATGLVSTGLVDKTPKQTQRNDLGLSLLPGQARNREPSGEHSHYRSGDAFSKGEGRLGRSRAQVPQTQFWSERNWPGHLQ